MIQASVELDSTCFPESNPLLIGLTNLGLPKIFIEDISHLASDGITDIAMFVLGWLEDTDRLCT